MKRKASELHGQTLYIRNLDNKVSTNDLRMSLFMLFSTYGRILALNANKSPRMRGQAHIGFENSTSARNAKRELHGTEFLGKKLVIEYAKEESQRVEWAETYEQ